MVIIMLTTVLALLLASAAFSVYDYVTFREKILSDLEALVQTLDVSATAALVFHDTETATRILSGLELQPHIITALIFDQDGDLFAEFTRGDRQAALPAVRLTDGHEFRDGNLTLQHGMRFGDQRAGTFYIESDLLEMVERRADQLKILVAVILSVSVLAFFFSSVLQGLVSKPILALANVAHTVSEKKDYSVRVERQKQGNDEIGLLIGGFNEMLSQIQIRDQELQIARDKAEQANRSKSAFLANMSHELRTPLTAIIGYSEILEDDAGEMGFEDFLPDLAKIKGAGRHLLGLINSILDLSKVESGKMELFIESFDLLELVTEVASTIKPLMEKNGNTLEIVAEEDLGSVRADLTKTRQILFNLLSNASKFTENGQVKLEVRRVAENGTDRMFFVVADSGIGMSPEQLQRLFKSFSQADASTARKYGGTGLGLALCKRFCQVLGGSIEVVSELGKGTTFTVQLPAEMEQDKSIAVHQLVESGQWNQLEMAKAAPGDDRLVLVIDDDPAVHDLLRDLLEKEGFRVATAAGGKRGLELADQLRPAIITLDVNMPDLDGWTVLTTLKSSPQLAAIPVIMISISDQRQKGYAMGVEFLTKPIDRERLIALLAPYRSQGTTPEILVVDDDPEMRAILRKMLEDLDCSVSEAENGLVALRRIAESRPSLILLDLIMPQLDGFGFMAQMRKDSALKSTPVVVLTAMDLGPEEIARLNGGVERILQKGAFSLDELKAEIRSLARGSVHA